MPRFTFRQRQSPYLLLGLSIITTFSVVLFWAILGNSPNGMSLKRDKKNLKFAFATILLPPTDHDGWDADPYFTSTRMINYQLNHSPHTGSKRNIPFLVIVTQDILPLKRTQLEQEGATVITMDRINLGSDWVVPMATRWKDVMLKLRLFEIIEYDRILFLDADTYLLKPMDGIFNDPAASPHKVLPHHHDSKAGEVPLPENYFFATLPEIMHTTHTFPPHPWKHFNAGFFLFSPSLALFEYYISLLGVPGRFDSTYPEQNLLNYAHRDEGHMPWAHLDYRWNVVLPNMNDVKMGVRSVHAKLWTEGTDLQPVPEELRARWNETRVDMEAHYVNARRAQVGR